MRIINFKFLENPYMKSVRAKFIPFEDDTGKIKYTADKNIAVFENDSFPMDRLTYDGKDLSFYFDGKEIVYEKPTDILEAKFEIDWEYRLTNMQNALCLSILKKVLMRNYGAEIISSTILENSSLTISAKDISYTRIKEIEKYINYLIQANLIINRVDSSFDKINYIAEIKGLGKFQSFGPLLSRSGELGIFKINKITKNNDGNIELSFLVGKKAFDDYQEKFDLVENLKSLYKLNDSRDILTASRSLKMKFDSLVKENKKMEKELNLETVNELKSKALTYKDYSIIYKIINSPNFKELKFTSQKIIDMDNYIQIYGMPNGPTSSFMLARSKNLISLNLKSIVDDLSKQFDITCSGNMVQVQGNCKTIELVKILDVFIKKIKEIL
ncbi:hypothetical protein LV469_01625 [Peptoniphilus sp. GNH]|nr:hypothetical protein LV469_01625 [Peptoniphilus sp. GNH]